MATNDRPPTMLDDDDEDIFASPAVSFILFFSQLFEVIFSIRFEFKSQSLIIYLSLIYFSGIPETADCQAQ